MNPTFDGPKVFTKKQSFFLIPAGNENFPITIMQSNVKYLNKIRSQLLQLQMAFRQNIQKTISSQAQEKYKSFDDYSSKCLNYSQSLIEDQKPYLIRIRNESYGIDGLDKGDYEYPINPLTVYPILNKVNGKDKMTIYQLKSAAERVKISLPFQNYKYDYKACNIIGILIAEQIRFSTMEYLGYTATVQFVSTSTFQLFKILYEKFIESLYKNWQKYSLYYRSKYPTAILNESTDPSKQLKILFMTPSAVYTWTFEQNMVLMLKQPLKSKLSQKMIKGSQQWKAYVKNQEEIIASPYQLPPQIENNIFAKL